VQEAKQGGKTNVEENHDGGHRLSLSQTLSCLAVDRESDDDRVQ
jgi:hypothetical protein